MGMRGKLVPSGSTRERADRSPPCASGRPLPSALPPPSPVRGEGSLLHRPLKLGPLALAHHGGDGAVLADTVDVDLAGAEHPVDVDVGSVAAAAGDLLGGDGL